jgi:hypothetical protein
MRWDLGSKIFHWKNPESAQFAGIFHKGAYFFQGSSFAMCIHAIFKISSLLNG